MTILALQLVYLLLWVVTVVQGQEVTCGTPPSILNGASMNTIIEGTVMYSCDPGYTLSGSSTVTCQASGNWSTLPSCELPPAYLSLNYKLYLINNSVIEFDSIGESDEQALICHTDSMVCCNGASNPENDRGMGQWLYPNGTNLIANHRINESGTDILFRSRDVQMIRLHRRGNVTMPTGLYCCVVPTASGGETVLCVQIAFCGSPPSIANGSPGALTSTMVGGTVNYNCDPGYIHSGSAAVTCLSTGEWTTPPSCQATPLVYLSLSSTNYLSVLPVISLSSVGEGRGNSLVCHTDLDTCCSSEEGVWHYPNGSAVSADSTSSGLYVSREQMSVSLNYRSGVATVTAGLYCCVLPTSQGMLHQCIVLETPQDLPFNPQSCLFDILVGGVVGGVVVVLVVCLTIAFTTHLMLRHRRGKGASMSNGSPHSGIDQNAAPTYETVPEAISALTTRNDSELALNEAYANTTVTECGRGN